MVQNSSLVALITGAGMRIGRAIALDLAGEGWAVAVHYHHSVKEAEATVADIVNQGGRAVAVRADLGREEQTETLIRKVADSLGAVTCLVNNASVFEYDNQETATRESWQRHMEVNLRAPFVLTQAFARQLPERRDGNVINILDQRVWNLTPHFVSYTVSKAGLWTLTQTLALALAPRIRVNAIGPGPTLPSTRQSEEQFEKQYRAMPLERQVRTEEICKAVRFLLDTPSMTGQMIALDSGQHMGYSHPANAREPEE